MIQNYPLLASKLPSDILEIEKYAVSVNSILYIRDQSTLPDFSANKYGIQIHKSENAGTANLQNWYWILYCHLSLCVWPPVINDDLYLVPTQSNQIPAPREILPSFSSLVAGRFWNRKPTLSLTKSYERVISLKSCLIFFSEECSHTVAKNQQLRCFSCSFLVLEILLWGVFVAYLNQLNSSFSQEKYLSFVTPKC